MATQQVWIGASGRRYTYFVYPVTISIAGDQDGNYIFTKQNSNRDWVAIYIGEGNLTDRISDEHHQVACIKSKGATHVHCHLNSDRQTRRREESDLLARFTNAYKPQGCNEKRGG